MATGSSTTPQQVAKRSPIAVIEYDRYIDQQIRKTSGQVKLVDLVSRLLAIGIGLLAVLLGAAIAEHWIVPGGFPNWLRWLAFALIVVLAGWYSVRFLWPLIARRINPIYSAQTIERHSPNLKNSLLNLLFFRQRREQVPDVVYQAVEQQAAMRLTAVGVETAVDRTMLVRTLSAFLGLLVAACLYQVISPKNPLATAGRVLCPWANIRTPTRVLIDAIHPGDIEVARGEPVEITAVVRGRSDGESVLLRYSTEDGQAIRQAIPMVLDDDGYHYRGQLPGEPTPGRPEGIQQNMKYAIEAGDARTPDFQITLIDRPTITVDRIELDYPDYTQFTNQVQKYHGDIQAIEGTRVTIHAQTNDPVQSAYIDLNCDGTGKAPLNRDEKDPRRVSGAFDLALNTDRRTPKYLSYSLHFTNQTGRQNPNPIRYRIDTIPDYAPEVSLLAPAEERIDVQLNQTLQIEVEARDPDFVLAQVQLRGTIEDKPVFEQNLLAEEYLGRFHATWTCIPSKMKLEVGDEITYWAVAADNRTPDANVTVSRRQCFRVVADPHTEEQNQETANGANEPDPDQSTPASDGQPNQGNANEATEPDASETTDPNASGSTESNPKDGTDPNASETTDPNANGSTEPNPKDGTDPNADETTDPNANGSTEPNAKDGTDPNTNNTTDPNTGTATESTDSATAESTDQDAGTSATRGSEPADTPTHGSQGAQQDPGSSDRQAARDNPQGTDQQDRRGGPGDREMQPQENPSEGGPGDSRPQQATGSDSEKRDQESPAPEPIDAEGSDDGTAFERIRQHFEQQAETRESRDPPGSGTQPDSPNDTGSNQTSNNAQEGTSAKVDPNQAQPQNGPIDPADAPDGSPAASDQSAVDPAKDSTQGTSKTRPDAQEDPSSPSRGGRESDSEGDSEGGRTDPGHEGNSPKTPHEGTGSTGQNEAADSGVGRSADHGPGETSEQGGNKKLANEKTGESSDHQPGPGSGQRPGDPNSDRQGPSGNNSRPGDRAGDPAESGDRNESAPQAGRQDAAREGETTGKSEPDPTATGQESETPNEPSNEWNPLDPSNPSGSSGASDPQSGGPSDGPANRPKNTEIDPNFTADEANLDYARKQTDLILDRLSNQLEKERVDEELLDKLGWSEEDLRRFVARWSAQKEAARGDSPTATKAQAELEDALRSLGLGKRRLRSQDTAGNKDTLRDLRDAYRGATPPEFQLDVHEYLRKVASQQQEE